MIRDYEEYELSPKQTAVFLTAGFCCLSVASFLFFRSILLSLLCGPAVFLFLGKYRSYLAEKRRKLLIDQFRDLLTSLSASIGSGRQMETALVEAYVTLGLMYGADAPIMIELKNMKKSILENNSSDAVLLSDLAQRSGSDDIRSFVQVYLTCRSTGGNVEKVISHTSKVMAEKMDIEKQIAVITAQKKLEGRIISAMPFAMLIALNLFSPAYISPLYSTIGGRIVMILCIIGILSGIWLMERLTDIRRQS